MPKFVKPKEDKKNILSKLKWLDPFTYVDYFVMPRIKKITQNKIIENIVNIFFAGLFAIIIYLILGLFFGTSNPLVIVYSESMEPSFYRGDIIGLTNINNQNFGEEIFLDLKISDVPTINFVKPFYNNNQLEKIVFSNGEEIIIDETILNNSVIVYNSFPTNIPIIHRSIVKIIAIDGNFVLTKGDNKKTNPTFDQDCGLINQIRNTSQNNCVSFYAIPIEQVQGVKFFQIPKIGCVKLWLFDNLVSIITIGKLPRDFKGVC
jgi:signal peptidase I